MFVTVFSQFFQFRDSFAALIHGQRLITDDIPQSPVVVRLVTEFLRLALLFHTLVLEEQFALTDVLCFFYDRVLDRPELFLL